MYTGFATDNLLTSYRIPLCPIILNLISSQCSHSELKLFLAKSSSRISSLMFDPVGPCVKIKRSEFDIS